MLDGLKVLCFDLDDTFWDIRRVLERAEQRVAHFLGERYPKLARHSRSDLLAARMALAREMPERAHDLTWLRTETLRRLAVDDGYPDHVGAEAFDVFIAARNEVELFPDVRPALERLAARCAHDPTFPRLLLSADIARKGRCRSTLFRHAWGAWSAMPTTAAALEMRTASA